MKRAFGLVALSFCLSSITACSGAEDASSEAGEEAATAGGTTLASVAVTEGAFGPSAAGLKASFSLKSGKIVATLARAGKKRELECVEGSATRRQSGEEIAALDCRDLTQPDFAIVSRMCDLHFVRQSSNAFQARLVCAHEQKLTQHQKDFFQLATGHAPQPVIIQSGMPRGGQTAGADFEFKVATLGTNPLRDPWALLARLDAAGAKMLGKQATLAFEQPKAMNGAIDMVTVFLDASKMSASVNVNSDRNELAVGHGADKNLLSAGGLASDQELAERLAALVGVR